MEWAVEEEGGRLCGCRSETVGEGSAASRSRAGNLPTSQMVLSALTALRRRKGTSYQAIKKYIRCTYKRDVEKLTPHVKRFLKSAVSCGILRQVTGKGARGSFKLVKRQRNAGSKSVTRRTSDELLPRNKARESKEAASASVSDSSLHKSTCTSRLRLRDVSSHSDVSVGPKRNISVSTSTDALSHPFFDSPCGLEDIERKFTLTDMDDHPSPYTSEPDTCRPLPSPANLSSLQILPEKLQTQTN